jgi:hypothetical protein
MCRKIFFILQTRHAICCVVDFYSAGILAQDRRIDSCYCLLLCIELPTYVCRKCAYVILMTLGNFSVNFVKAMTGCGNLALHLFPSVPH